MREIAQVVQLNDYEINVVFELMPHIQKLGKGFRWKRDIPTWQELTFYIEESAGEKMVITGRFGDPRVRLMIKGNHVSFSTVGATSPEALFYDLMHLINSVCKCTTDLFKPPPDIYETFSTDTKDYYIMNNKYTERISEYFGRIVAEKKDNTCLSGMFYIETASGAYGKDKAKALVQEFAEKSLYDEVAFALVFHRGHALPLFYGNGAIFCLLAEKDYVESIQKDFTRVFMKFAAPESQPIIDMGQF